MARRTELYNWDHISGPHDGGGDGHTCDCRIEGGHQIAMCVAQAAYQRDVDAHWAADLIRACPDVVFTAEYIALAAPYLRGKPRPNNEDLR